MSTEITKTQAAPIQWVEENGVWTSKCGVYRIETRLAHDNDPYCACFERGTWFGNQLSPEQARDLCQLDRQREYDIMGGHEHEGVSALWG